LLGIELLGNLLEVTTTAELAGTAFIKIANVGGNAGPLVELPLKVKLDDTLLHLLGPSCYIGSESEPVKLVLTDGTTNPPPPNQPISGNPGNLVIKAEGRITGVTGNTIVDNAFSAPGVNGCAGILAPVVDLSVDLKAGLPSAAGKNTAIMSGSVINAESRIVKTEAEIPQFGHCAKLVGVKEGKITKFGGKYSTSNCVTESAESLTDGRFEWTPGPGPNPKFTGEGAISSFETVGKTKVLCSANSSSGEYTGPKTEKVAFTFTGCESTSLHTACQSPSAGSGEIRTAALVGELGFTKDSEPLKPAVGLAFRPESGTQFAAFECGGLAETVSGSVIGTATPIDSATKAVTSLVNIKANKGLQVPEAFEEMPKDVLSAAVTTGSGTTTEQVGLTARSAVTGEEATEIKARAF
jgi:hypothetical protein